MPITKLTPDELRLSIAPESLGFTDTSELINEPLPWIGQKRAQQAAQFGLGMQQADYNLIVLGEVGSGRSSLMKQAMSIAAANRPAPPDLCFLHNFDAPECPSALHIPAGKGKALRKAMAQMSKSLVTEIPQQLQGTDYKLERERIEKAFKVEETQAFNQLEVFAEARNFSMRQESGQLLFTLLGTDGKAMSEEQLMALSKEERASINESEEELLAEINTYFERTRPLERRMEQDLDALQKTTIRPLLEHELHKITSSLGAETTDSPVLSEYFRQVSDDVLENLDLYLSAEGEAEVHRLEALQRTLASYRVNLVVDNSELAGAPVIIENNPLHRSLFGSIEYHTENEALVTDFSQIRAGSLIQAHGGFLMLHLRDLLADPLVWEKLRRFLRSGVLQIEEPGTAFAPIATLSLSPKPVSISVKIILIASPEHYYELQEGDPEFARRFRVKVDFVEEFVDSKALRQATSVFVAQTCLKRNLPHFSAEAVARLLEESHRETDDQRRQSAAFGHLDARIVESAPLSLQRNDVLVRVEDVEQAQRARRMRHDYPEQRMRESISDGDVLIEFEGSRVGQVNGLSVIDLGDHRFGFPVRVSARTHAGEDGLTNIEREVEMSGPIHDKGVFILQNYLAALFERNAPLCFTGSIVFEQEYHGIEGDSASCAELFALLSALAGVPIHQGIAVTGALNQHGEVLPVGGINEKIEGYYRICQDYGLTGNQGVIIPERNRRNLMLDHEVCEAVATGRFTIYSMAELTDGIELLTGLKPGQLNARGQYPKTSLFGHVQNTLKQYHRRCNAHDRPRG